MPRWLRLSLPASAATAAVVAALGAGTAAVTVVAGQRDGRGRAADQRALAQRAAAALDTRLDASVARLQDLAVLVAAVPDLHDDAFRTRAGAVLADPAFSVVAQVDAVPRARRAAWEAAHGPISDVRGPRRGPAADRPLHLPVVRATAGARRDAIGLDLAAEPSRRRTIVRTLQGRPSVTGRVRLLRDGRAGLVVAVPVPGGGRVVAAALDGGRLGASLAAVLPRDADVRVLDGDEVLAAVGDAPQEAPVARRVAVAGRELRVVAGPRDLGPGLALPAALGGGAVTLLLGLLVWQAARRERYALALVDARMAERDRSEAARAAAERNFVAAFEDAPIGMTIVDLDGRIERVNAAMVRITGFPRDRLQAMSAADLVHPDDRAAEAAGTDRLLRGDVAHHAVDRRCLHALGDVVWVSVTQTLLRGDEPRLLVQVQDITERRRSEAQLQYLADHDPLTGLLNRRSFELELRRHLEHGGRPGSRGAVVVLDIDDFKSVNDTLGHSAGDALITDVGQALRGRLRASDVLARLGGDEFAALLPRVGEDEALTVAEDLLEGIRALQVRRADGRTRAVSSSAGVALVRAEPGRTVDDVLVQADVAMYEAKEAGGDRTALHREDEPGEQPRVLARLTWADRIRAALEEDRFVLHAQPIVDLRTGQTTQHELLLRMVGEDGGVVAPGAFLHVAERTGLMPAIDRWVVARAIELLAEQPELVLEVNLSGASTGDAEVLRLIETGIAAHGVDASRLIFEVTETVAISNIPRAQHFAERLAELGCRFALDDFGAGFGSFFYLKHLPFDVLKIDGEFVRQCTSSATDQVLIKAVVDIARGLGKRTVAEHVGDDATAALLREAGVDLGQGFHLGRPDLLPAPVVV